MENGLPVVEVSGPSYERGCAHGEACREIIKQTSNEYFAFTREHSEELGLPVLTTERRLLLTNRCIPFAKEYAPELCEELRGIADGADIGFEDLFSFNCFLEIWDWMHPTFLTGTVAEGCSLCGCTAFAVAEPATSGGTFVGQNYDFPTLFEPAAMLLRIRGDESETLVFTYAGVLGCAGLGSGGVACVINNLTPSDARSGVPYPFILRRILAQERIGDSIDAVLGAHRASGLDYVLGDMNGEVYALETSATDYKVIHGFDGWIAHSNHYVTDPMRSYERRSVRERGHSIVRYNRMTKMVRGWCGTIDLAATQSFLQDHVNWPASICRHEERDNIDSYTSTNAALIFDPVGGRAWAARGNPCVNPFAEYSITEASE